MFAVIKLQAKKSFKSIKVEAVRENDITYYIFSVRNKNNINWERLSNLLGDLKTRVIFLDGISPPHHYGVKALSCERYEHKLAVSALDKLLTYADESLYDKSALLIDMQCRYQSYADVLVEHFKQVKIITSKIEFYNNYSDSKLYECGAAVSIVRGPGKPSEKYDLIVTPSGVIFAFMEDTTMPIVSATQIGSIVKSAIYSTFFEQPSELAKRILNRIGCGENCKTAHDIMGALYEFCGSRQLGKNPIGGFKSNERITLDDIKINIFSLDKDKETLYNE